MRSATKHVLRLSPTDRSFGAGCGRHTPRGVACVAAAMLSGVALLAADPWADRVVSFNRGAAPTPGYDNPVTALGAPERVTGEGFGFTGVVSVFNPAFGTDELVSIGEGGWLTVEFNEPILDDPANKFGIDFIVFGNGGFVDGAFPSGRTTIPPTTFGLDAGMRISVSADGATFISLGEFTEGFLPAQGYRDRGPFADMPGLDPTDFTVPTNPFFTLDEFSGVTLNDILALYDGSGGGTPIDIASSGLASIRFVRVELLDDADPTTNRNVEIEAFATTPEPGGALVFMLLIAGLRGMRRA